MQHHQDLSLLAQFIFGHHVAYAPEERAVLSRMPDFVDVFSKDVETMLTGPPWSKTYYFIHAKDFERPFLNLLPLKFVDYPELLRRIETNPLSRLRCFVFDPVLSPDFLRELRGNNSRKIEKKDILFKSTQRLTVAMHVRHGDVPLQATSRITANDYYIALADRIRGVYHDAEIVVFSSLENATDPSVFKDFDAHRIPVYLEDRAPVRVAWTNMIVADILILAKSEFGMVPAIVNSNCVVFQPKDFHVVGVMDSWVTSDQFDEQYIRSCYKR